MTCKHCGISESTVRWQAQRIEELEAQLAFWGETKTERSTDIEAFKAQHALRMGRAEWAMLSALLQNEYVSSERLFAESGIGREWAGTPGDFGYIHVTIHHIRAKIKAIGLSIACVRGKGYSINRDAPTIIGETIASGQRVNRVERVSR